MGSYSRRGLLGLTAALAAAIACSSSSGGDSGGTNFCQNTCPPYVSCLGTGIKVPLFCSIDPMSVCQPACESAVSGLDQSEGTFIGCADCVLQYDAKDICDQSKSQQTGQVSCANTCSGAGDASNKFYSDFGAAFQQQLGMQISGSACTQTGTKQWKADDPAITHGGVGADGGNGTWLWSCREVPYCFATAMMGGPGVSLPPGSYTAGFTGVTNGGLEQGWSATIWVGNGPTAGTAFGSAMITDPTKLSGTLTVPFTLTRE